MDYPIKILGEIRASDQIIRLNLPFKVKKKLQDIEVNKIPEIYIGRGAYIHEWSHYIQFSITPIGIIISKLRRDIFLDLLGLLEDLNEFSMPKFLSIDKKKSAITKFKRHEDIFEFIRIIWKTWPEDWFTKFGNVSNIISTVSITHSGLIVNFEGCNQDFRLPLGPAQIFESWAWIEENFHSHAFLDFEIDYSVENLIYTWPIHTLVGIIGKEEFEKNKATFCWDLISLLIASSFYDPFAWKYRPLAKSIISKELIKKNTSIERVIYQFFRSIKDYLYNDRSKNFGSFFNDYTDKNGLPKLKACLEELQIAVNELIEKTKIDGEDRLSKISSNVSAFTEPYKTELAILTTTAKNLEVFNTNYEKVLTDPFTNSDKFETPLVAEFNGLHYDWKIIRDIFQPKGKYDFNKLYQKEAGYTFLEHIVYQLLFSEHIACYGSLLWQHPIERCEHIETCLQIKNKRGIKFCKNIEWKGLVYFYIEILSNTYCKGILPKGILGLHQIKSEIQEHIKNNKDYYMRMKKNHNL